MSIPQEAPTTIIDSESKKQYSSPLFGKGTAFLYSVPIAFQLIKYYIRFSVFNIDHFRETGNIEYLTHHIGRLSDNELSVLGKQHLVQAYKYTES